MSKQLVNSTPHRVGFENLVFEGGGVKGSAYAGCIEVLDQLGHYTPVKQVAGTSAGAITATLLATGGGSTGLLESVETTHFSRFIADKFGVIGDVKRAITDYGLHTGNEFVEILKKNITQFCGHANITFSQLDTLADQDPKTFKKLSIIASNLTKQQPELFNSQTHPDLPVWHAVRASMSIPLLFEPAQINGDYYVDGGLAWNYPIDLFDRVEKEQHGPNIRIPNRATLGFFLEPHDLMMEQGHEFKSSHIEIDSIKSFALGLSSFLYTTANAQHMQACDKSRTVFIDDLGISATEFDLPKDKIEALIDSGRQAAERYFKGLDNQQDKHVISKVG